MTECKTITGLEIGKYELTLVGVESLGHVLMNVEESLIQMFEERDFQEYDMEELRRRLYAGEAQLWLVGEKGVKLVMIAVSRVLRYPCVKRLSMDLILGEDMEGCIVLLEAVGNWAKQYGCTEIEASCRPGVRKIMTKHGFVKLHEVIVKPISGSTH